jgi:hypothetical protein
MGFNHRGRRAKIDCIPGLLATIVQQAAANLRIGRAMMGDAGQYSSARGPRRSLRHRRFGQLQKLAAVVQWGDFPSRRTKYVKSPPTEGEKHLITPLLFRKSWVYRF